MVVVDSSVWIDYLRDLWTPQTVLLEGLLATARVITADLVAAEVLQGVPTEKAAALTFDRLRLGAPLAVGGMEIAFEAARNYRRLRALGITPRKTIDTLIATRCIADGLPLLFSDRDFQPFVDHLGLIDAMTIA